MKNNKKTITVKAKVSTKQRVMWDINPVTRKPANPRAYNRRREKKNIQREVKCYV